MSARRAKLQVVTWVSGRLEDAQAGSDDEWIELRACALHQPGTGNLFAEGGSIRAVGRHRVEGVADEDDPRLDRDLFARKPVG